MLLEQVPAANQALYPVLYCIEISLRELIIEALARHAGPRWWKERLPSDVLSKYKEGISYERGVTWTQLTPHHPLYYVDFPDLIKVIRRQDNWRDVFQPIFGREQVFVGTLTELEPIRNIVAHNRKASDEQITIANAALQKIATSIGEAQLEDYVRRAMQIEDIWSQLASLHREGESALAGLRLCQPILLEIWPAVSRSWWFDEDYLGHKIEAIERAFRNFSDYGNLPRLRGSGHKIEQWVAEAGSERQWNDAERTFKVLLRNEP